MSAGDHSDASPLGEANQEDRDARYRAIFEAAVEGMITINERGVIESINGSAERMFGYAREEVVGRNVSILMPRPYREEHDAYLARYLRTGEKKIIGVGREVVGRRKDGTEFPIHLSVSEVTLSTGRIFTGFVQDLTELNEANRRLVQAERLAAIGEAMTRLAHESRNALQRAQASLDLLAEELGGDPRIRELLDSIGRAMDDLHRLYEEVRAFAAPICVRPEIVDIRDILRNAWSELASVCKDRTVCVRERATCDDLRCEVDPFGVGQVFRNIFDNALNACSDPVEISIEFADACEQGSPALSIRIRDNGPGLSPHEQQHVFDSFFTTKAEGTGLGMAIAYRIVDAHHGTIAVDPDCMNGAEFVVTLPRKQP